MNDIYAVPDVGPDLLRSPSFRHIASDDDFTAALEARSVVDTAVGITMGKHDCTRRVALATLLRTARTFDVTFLELARDIVASAE